MLKSCTDWTSISPNGQTKSFYNVGVLHVYCLHFRVFSLLTSVVSGTGIMVSGSIHFLDKPPDKASPSCPGIDCVSSLTMAGNSS